MDISTATDIARIRKEFPILYREMNGKSLVFLDSAASSQKPTSVINAISNYYNHQHANVHRGVYGLSQEATEAFEHGRLTIANFINATEEELIFTKGTTEGINLVASTFGKAFLQEGDEILITTLEHHSNIVPWQMVCEQYGAKLKVVPVNEAGEISLDDVANLISNKTKLISVVHVSNSLGTINPITEIIELAHNSNIPVLVDGAQAMPHLRVDVKALDVDFYVFSAHKMYGPTGIGALYGKREWLEKLPPYQGGGEMIETVTFEKTTYNVPPFKFEAGTPDISGAVGFGEAAKFICEIGHEMISRHEDELLTYATEKLRTIEGVVIHGTADKKASVISFNLAGAHPYDVGTILDKLGIAVRTGHHCCQPLMARLGIPGTVRASFGIYNNKEDIDHLVAGVERASGMLL